MHETRVKIPDISCGHCTASIKSELMEIPGVEAVEADAASKEVLVKWSAPASWERITETLKEIGFPPEVIVLPAGAA